MNTTLFIETAHGGLFFSLTYLAAFVVASGIMIHQGFKKGYPKSAWLLIILTGVVFFIIGTKVATYSSEQWSQVITRFQFPQANGKTILGGIIGLFAGIFIAKTWLQFNRPVLDSLAIALPLSMAISRIGCLMAGCCYGTPTHLPWGVQYDASSLAYHVHLAQGLIHSNDASSLTVHPAQIYQVIGCLIIALIVWRSRKQWKSSGSQFLFSVLAYLVLRFFVEFVRAPESNFFAGHVILGVKIVQWFILGAILPGLLILIFRESKKIEDLLKDKNYRKDAKTLKNTIFFFNSLRLSALAVKDKKNLARQNHVSDLRQVLLTILLSIFVLTTRNWFDLLELTTIILFFVIVIITLSKNIYQKYSVAGFRWVVPVMLVFSFSFMAQKRIPDGKKRDKITFTEVGISGVSGKYFEELQEVSRGCGHNSYSTVAQQSVPFYQAGGNVSYNIWQGRDTKYAFGARLFFGDEFPEQTATHTVYGPVYGISPYASLNWHWFGFTTGFSVGQIKIPLGKSESRESDGEIISKRKCWYKFIPSLAMRIGSADVFYAEGSFPGLFPYATASPQYRVGIGTGWGKSDGTSTALGYCDNGLYLKMVYPIKNKFVVEAFYADNFQTGNRASRILSFGFNYRFIDEEKYKDHLTVYTTSYNDLVAVSDPVKKLNNKVEDIDGNLYTTVTIGGQVWMAENLKVTHFQDGSKISDAPGIDQGSGRQYNWQAVNNSSKLCPAGWHVPSINEWRSLVNSLGSLDMAAGKLEDGFNIEGDVSQWWSSTEQDSLQAQSLYLNNQTIGIMFASAAKKTGLNVRCMRD